MEINKRIEDTPLKIKYISRLKGHTRLPRQEFYFLKDIMNDGEFCLYILLSSVIVDWDKKHALYGHYTYDIQQIQIYTNWSPSKVNRLYNSLITKGFIEIVSPRQKLHKLFKYGSYEIYKDQGITKENPFIHLKTFLDEIKTKMVNQNSKLEQYYSNLKNDLLNFIGESTKLHTKYSFSSKEYSGDEDNNGNIIGNEDVDFSELLEDKNNTPF